MADMPETLAEALARLQCQLPRIGKDSTAQIPGKEGKRGYEYKYADLATISRDILPLLGMLGLSFMCMPDSSDGGQFYLRYVLQHAPSGDREVGLYPLPSSGSPQQIGSAITYARRYCLCAVTGLVADEDDDGEAAERLIAEARALRRADPEVDAHGAATVAEQTRMITGREPGTTRWRPDPTAGTAETVSTGAPGSSAAGLQPDPWLDGPAGLTPQDLPEDRHGTATADQIRALQAAFTAKGIKDRNEKIMWLGDKFGRDIHSSKDLSYTQAARALQELR